MIEEKELPREETDVILLRDTFDQERRAGTVIGSHTADGTKRLGIDAEGIIGIDNSALRIGSLLHAGWGRAGIAYGPFQRENGLAFGVFMLNGHNTSQLDHFTDPFTRRMIRWFIGAEPKNVSKMLIAKRRARWMLSSRHTSRLSRRVRWWRILRSDSERRVRFDENLAVGWFTGAVPGPELPEGNTFVMHALGAENGELWASGGKVPLPAVRSVQNLQIYFVVVLREHGAAYYAASLPDAHGLSAFPHLRPLAIEPFRDDAEVYAGVHQGVSGQIGFRSETRVYGATVGKLGEFSAWYGSAHAADSLVGDGDQTLRAKTAEIGGNWRIYANDFAQIDDNRVRDTALLYPGAPSGLIHAVMTWIGVGKAGLVFRAADAHNHWALRLGAGEARLEIVQDGVAETIAAAAFADLDDGKPRSVQVLDDGSTIAAFLDGTLLFDNRFVDTRLALAEGVGLWSDSADTSFRNFEAHPRTIEIPAALDLGSLWYQLGEKVVVSETFDGEARLLEGKQTTTGGKVWERTLGRGIIDVLGNGTAKVRATAAEPMIDRTIFSIDWDHAQFADLELDMTPPGDKHGEDEKGRCGVVFWQDADNFLMINIFVDDSHPGVSISTFSHLEGVEEMYDAVWTMMIRHVYRGKPCRLRVVFDGVNYLCFVNDEPVLYRALTDVYPDHKRLSITRVGVLANWEWGTDTGTTLSRFTAKV